MVYPPGTSKLYHDAGAQILSWLEDESIAFNYHSGGATPSTFTRFPALGAEFVILSTSKDRQGRTFVSSMEGVTLPFYGVQFHPEKVLYERGLAKHGGSWPYEDISHTPHAVAYSQFMANFFVREARKNRHAYTQGIKASIYQYAYTQGSKASIYQHAYTQGIKASIYQYVNMNVRFHQNGAQKT